MYKSPIDVCIADIQCQIDKQVDEGIYKAVVNVGVNVDKEELLRALSYDRNQYEKGYADGKADGKADAMAELVRCKDCKYYREGKVWEGIKFCFRLRGMDGEPVGYNFSAEDFCSRGERKDNERKAD